jgi:MinD-like ATPase involved in chromosome partitioning or flagellar assembly
MIITVSSMKGGVGKTEAALNLAMAIKKTGRSVVLIDLDIPYGGVAQALGETKEISVTDWIRTNRDISVKALKSLVAIHAESGLNYIPAIASATDIAKLDGNVINRLVSNLDNIYDYIIIDSGVDFSPPTIEALRMSDKIVIITTPNHVSAQNNYRYKEDLVELGVSRDKLLLFINMIREKKADDVVDRIVETFSETGVPVETVAAVYWEDGISRTRECHGFATPGSSFARGIEQVLKRVGVANPGFSAQEKSVEQPGLGILGFLRGLLTR